MGNAEIQAMLTAMGTGHGSEFDLSKARYHKLIIMTDADVDGAHIRTLLLTFLFHYMPGLIEAGYVYIAQPPLYKVTQGKNFHFVFNDQALEEERKTWKKGSNITVQRFKGLGEMSEKELWETTMDPATRTMQRVHLEEENLLLADETFNILMGDSVEPRREFIEKNAVFATIDNQA